MGFAMVNDRYLLRQESLGWLLLIQILHCGTFTVCHLAAMRFIAARQGQEVIRLQAVYSALAMGGVLLYEHRIVNPNDLARVNVAFFDANMWLALTMLAGVVVDVTWRTLT